MMRRVRLRAVYPIFTRDIEARIVAWMQEHEFIYIKLTKKKSGDPAPTFS
jgi:hypothetical protein